MSTSPGALEARQGIPGRRISRSRLGRRLRDALDSGSVIITAGAGFGKTTALEQALRDAPTPVAWVTCSDAERVAGALLMRVVNGIAVAAPGTSDVLAERLAVGLEPVDVHVATGELIAELSRLLVEPLLVVFDDAEFLDGVDGSQRLIAEMIRAELPLLHVAVASRRSLDLRVAKPRAAGLLTELGPADLAFDAEECAAVLRARTGIDPSPAQVDATMEATEGWPLGTVLAAGVVEREGEASNGSTSLVDLSSTPDVRAYLSEELIDSLDAELREAAIDSSVARVVTPEVALALELPEDFEGRISRAGLPVRRVGGDGAFTFHPLLREFLLEQLLERRSAEQRRALHAAVAPAVGGAGDPIGAIEHWLEAESWPEMLAAVEREGPALLRTSPELMTRWFELLPAEVRARPTIRMLEGQLEWGAGQHELAVGPLREAVAGYREAGDPKHEWLARFFLAEALFSAGSFEEMLELTEGGDGSSAPRSHIGAAGTAWYKVLALAALGRTEEGGRLADGLRRDAKTATRFSYLDDLATLLVELAAGGAEHALTELEATIRELELDDPQGRLAVSLAVTGLVHLDIGEVEAAMGRFERCQSEAERRGLGFVARDAHLQRASLLAQRGDRDLAELELGRAGESQGTGWRGVSRHTAEAFVASGRGDATEAVAAAQRALARVRPGLLCYRVWAALDMAIVFAENGAPDLARGAIEEALSAVDEQFPGELGGYHRARLLATRAWLEYETGGHDSAYADLRRSWEEAGERAKHVVRAHWSKLRPVIWQALADGAIDTVTVLPSLENALPGGEALLAFTDHPQDAVRRAAVPAALASNHPAILSQLEQLVEDDDAHVASIAVAAQERLRRRAPALRFAVLGRFRVARGGWEIAEDNWSRPIDERLVRFLLVHLDEPVPEDLIFEALWPDLTDPSSARRSLQVAVSRTRRVLDLPTAERSAIEVRDRAYRLALGERDVVDAEEFRAAAEAALAEPDERRHTLLVRARSLWTGEPLPEERYSDWATAYRERLVDRHIAVLTALVQLHHRGGEHAHAADAARELIDIDPLNEEGHRALMTAYARTGRRSHALRQFLECRRALIDQLGIEPAEETARLQARILAGETV
ncbi:MAG: BTAD domain-containing putative transcriptional regulator [Solirubrobacterales bacterium]